MKRFIAVALLLTAFIAAGTYSIADEAGGEKAKPAKKDKSSAPKYKVYKPWSELSDLTDDQKSRITEIQTKANEEMEAIKERAKQDITAVLTEEQKAKIAEMEKEAAEKRKEGSKKKDKGTAGE